MLIVGELINTSRSEIKEIVTDWNADAVVDIARKQKERGADYIDLNAGQFVKKEAEYLEWLVSVVQREVDTPCCIDSPDPKAIEAALKVHNGVAMINSISLETERYNDLLPVIKGTDCKVVALCMSDEGLPETADQRLVIADRLINGLVKNNVALENIYVDPLVQPISTNWFLGLEFINSVERIRTTYEGVHTICGLSNISYCLPNRPFINQAFMIMSITKGLDAAIVNPLDKRMMASIVTAQTLLGKDEFCLKYLMLHREKGFEF